MRSAFFLLLLVLPSMAGADIYKFVDEKGHITYTNMPRAGARRIDLNLPSDAPATHPRTTSPTPSDFPRVDASTQKKRDGLRRQLLLEELGNEQNNLRAALSAGGLSDAVRLHQKNIEMLNRELSHIR